ncbi:hypothetical protein IW262DRAFT_1552687 [Armillaria fumosa]|nr:hypothetical protein IW262DRAFT_1552687 [Armillaria fumosa]
MSFYDGVPIGTVFDDVEMEDILMLLRDHEIHVGLSITNKRDYLYYFIGNCNVDDQNSIRNDAYLRFHGVQRAFNKLSTTLLFYIVKSQHPGIAFSRISIGTRYTREELLEHLDEHDLYNLIHNRGLDTLEPKFVDGTSVDASLRFHHKDVIVDSLRLCLRDHVQPPTFADGVLLEEEYKLVTTPVLQWLCRRYNNNFNMPPRLTRDRCLRYLQLSEFEHIRTLINVHHMNSRTPTFPDNTSVQDVLGALPLSRAREILEPLQTIPKEIGCRRDSFIQFCAILPTNIANEFIAEIRKDYNHRIHYTKRLRMANYNDEQSFLSPVEEDCIRERLSISMNKTNNQALQESICVVCARIQNTTLTESMDVSAIPHPELLHPTQPHRSHILSHDMLLYGQERGPVTGNVPVCQDCLRSLRKTELPRLSLANNMWLGHVPPQLEILTLPERILIARYFPAAYIVKLYPKIKSAGMWNSETLSSGIRGNVSTYPLPHVYIASFSKPDSTISMKKSRSNDVESGIRSGGERYSKNVMAEPAWHACAMIASQNRQRLTSPHPSALRSRPRLEAR